MAVNLKEICENITLARQMALFGNYDSAEVYYEGSKQMIARLLVSITEPTRKNKWQQVNF